MRTRDRDVRAALHAKVLADHHRDPNTLVVDEFALWYGEARVDVAVLNGAMHGFEIKSDRDTLERLPAQERIYSAALDRVTLVIGKAHACTALELVPDWWGIKVVSSGRRGAVHFLEQRRPRQNPRIDPVAVASLLWRRELEDLLEQFGGARGLRSKPRHRLAQELATRLSLKALREQVREQMKRRTDWRPDAIRTQGGDSSPPGATS